MIQHEDNHIFTGLQRDISISKVQPNYLIDAHNIRLTAIENTTMLSMTNERGPKALAKFESGRYTQSDGVYTWNKDTTQVTIQGTYMGSCVINDYYILFTHKEDADRIYRIELAENPNDTTLITLLFSGTLNFALSNPLEILATYENESIQKIYWTDNLNQPRVINIAPYDDKNISKYLYNSFDFCPELKLRESVTVTKNCDNGLFAPGVIQYAFTYFNKFRQETSVFRVTPIQYISHYDRGASPEETCANSFTIKVSNLDTSFDYLRIYSIQRTAINGTPICKQLEDIYINGATEITFTDTGTIGSSIASTDLLYKGGQSILARTMCQKDGTLFLGNITLLRPSIPESIRTAIGKAYGTTSTLIDASISSWVRETLDATSINSEFDFHLNNGNCASFKYREYYRFGVQFQYKTGEWSDPIWIGDSQNTMAPLDKKRVSFHWRGLTSAIASQLTALGYKRARGVIATPSLNDRTIIAQGVMNGTVYRPCDRYGLSPNLDATEYASATKNPANGTTYAQASWLFRPFGGSKPSNHISRNYGGYISNAQGELISVFDAPQDESDTTEIGKHLRATEIGGYLKTSGRFNFESYINTFNSPDVLWDTDIQNYNYSQCEGYKVGKVYPQINYGDMDVTTSSTTMSSSAKGFIRRAFSTNENGALISQYCYQDALVDDDGENYEPHSKYPFPVMYPMYMWQPKGPINNDTNRSSNSSVLETKIISNYKYATVAYGYETVINTQDIKAFTADDVSMVKLGSNGYVYFGNADTVITVDPSPILIGGNMTEDVPFKKENESMWDKVNYTAKLNYYLVRDTTKVLKEQWGWVGDPDQNHSLQRLYYSTAASSWATTQVTKDFGDDIPGLTEKTNPIRMRYKSTPHLVMYSESLQYDDYSSLDTSHLYLADIVKKSIDLTTLYGGTSETSIKAIDWLPAGESIEINSATTPEDIVFRYGDTFYQRWDCLKTYAWSSEDANQVIDILSFPCESHINMDGRYDRNRGQHSNLHVSPTNYNLLNTVYSQMDNYFSYKILDKSYYEINNFPNQITWSLQKNAGVDVDPWCSLPLTSTYDMDGSKGDVTNLTLWNNNIFSFQEHGIANILFNERAQIATTEGTPIEISNNYKVEGMRYISDGIGVVNTKSIKTTPSGVYLIDDITKDLFQITAQGISNASLPKNMSIYFNSLDSSLWTPINYSTRIFYDDNNSDLYITTENESLMFSEKLTEFTSFMAYEKLYDMFNVQDSFYCLKMYGDVPVLYKMFAGDYNTFFHTDATLTTPVYKGYDFTYISNGRSTNPDTSLLNKVFTNLNFRADRWVTYEQELRTSSNGYSLPPFNFIRAWDEYQDSTKVSLEFIKDRPSSIKEKFRVWRCHIPRHYGSRDRITNSWCKLQLGYQQDNEAPNTDYFVLHDLNTIFYV